MAMCRHQFSSSPPLDGQRISAVSWRMFFVSHISVPHWHDFGLAMGAIYVLAQGGCLHLMSPVELVRSPLNWLELVAERKPRFTGGPNFALDRAVKAFRDNHSKLPSGHLLDMSDLVVASGGEPIHKATIEAWISTFEPFGFKNESIIPGYGLAEMVCGVTRHVGYDPSTVVEGHLPMGPCDIDDPFVKIVIVDPADGKTVLEDGERGEIYISAASAGDGYWNNPEATKAFRRRLPGFEGIRFYQSGDIGFRQDGQLYVSGRLKNMIIVRGENHHSEGK